MKEMVETVGTMRSLVEKDEYLVHCNQNTVIISTYFEQKSILKKGKSKEIE